MKFPRSPRRVFADSISRREALRFLATTSGAIALGPALAGCGDDSDTTAVGQPLRPEELDIDTVVIVMMENRSFDHYFGALSLHEGRSVDGLRPGFANPLPGGGVVPVFATGQNCIDDPPHGWTSSRRQIGTDGRNEGFVSEFLARLEEENRDPAAAAEVMGYFTRFDLPILYGLADEFAVFDRWFCSVLGPTWPNRFFLHSAQSDGRTNNSFPPPGGFRWPTIYDRLDEAGIDWKSYSGDVPFLFLFGNLQRQSDRVGNPIRAFFEDARSGNLPPVCYVEPAYTANDDHPPHDIQLGQAFLSSVVHAVAESPQWSRSMVIITYDEHGGFYDHVPPPIVPDERADLGFGQLGVRVPSLVVSPYTRRRAVSSELHEHSSVPAFIEWLFGLAPLTWRDAQANHFLDTFDLRRVRNGDPRPFPALPVIAVDPDFPEECLRFGGRRDNPEPDLGGFADSGALPRSFDGRGEVEAMQRSINRELLRLGKALPRRSL